MKWFKKRKPEGPLPTIFMEYKAKEVDVARGIIYFNNPKEFIKFINGKFREVDIVRLADGCLFSIINEGLKIVCLDEEGKLGKKDFKELITGQGKTKKP